MSELLDWPDLPPGLWLAWPTEVRARRSVRTLRAPMEDLRSSLLGPLSAPTAAVRLLLGPARAIGSAGRNSRPGVRTGRSRRSAGLPGRTGLTSAPERATGQTAADSPVVLEVALGLGLRGACRRRPSRRSVRRPPAGEPPRHRGRPRQDRGLRRAAGRAAGCNRTTPRPWGVAA